MPATVPLRRKLKAFVYGRGWPTNDVTPAYLGTNSITPHVLVAGRGVADVDVPDADVIISTFYTTAHAVEALHSSKGAKAIFIQGYEVDPGEVNPALDATWRMQMHKIVVSRWLRDLAETKFGDQFVSLVPNSVDLNQFHAPPRQKAMVPTVGFIHSNTPMKGPAVSLEALKAIVAKMPSVRIVSFGAEKPSLGLRLPAGAQFHCRPPQEKLRHLYSMCDVWLCTSVLEGFSLPLLEAMACRCPVVSTRAGGPLDIVEDGRNGHLVNVGDGRGVAEAALRILSLPQAEWTRMSDAAFARATAYSWDDATDCFEAALTTTIAIDRRDSCSSAADGSATRVLPMPTLCE